MRETFAAALQRELSQLATAVHDYDKLKQPYNKGELVDGMLARLRPHLLEANPEDIVHAVVCLAFLQPDQAIDTAMATAKKVRHGG